MSRLDLGDLLKRGNELEARFDSLSEDQPELQICLDDIREWLRQCVDYGRFLSDPSPERRALQGRVDYWTSLLSQRSHLLPDIDRLDDFDPTAGVHLDVPFPYPGLTAYSEKERTLFCGREREANDGVHHLEQYNALLVVSESGGGKSSLAMAGILPQLAEAHPNWLLAPRMTPGAHPVEALSNVLCRKLPALPAGFSGVAETEEAVRVAVQPVVEALNGCMLVLFIDQLEELLTLCNDNQQQAVFSALVCALAESGNCRVLATMRMDYLDPLTKSQSCRLLFALLAANAGVMTLAPLGFDAIHKAIRKPAQAVGLRFVPPGIVDKLAQQTANLVGGLPLLQFALWRLWESRPEKDGNKLDLINDEQLKALPNVQEALGKAAEARYEKLPPHLQKVCERLMLELTIPAENYQDPMRRRRRESEMVDLLVRYEKTERKEVEKLINDFVDAKLLVRTGGGENAQIEVAHEAIFRNWDTFRNWVSGEETKARLQAIRLIGREAALWAAQGRVADYLKLKGEPLEKALSYEKEGWLDEAASGYVKKCKGAERRRQWWPRIAWGFAIIFLFLLVVSGWIISMERQKVAAERQKVAAVTATVSNLMSLTSQLQPWDALDLANTLYHTLEQPGELSAPLAHAVDRMNGTQMLGNIKNRNSGIDFTASGAAVFQLEREKPESRPTRLNIYPIDDKGNVSLQPVFIDLQENQQGTLIGGGASPVDDPKTGNRLALLAFIKEEQSNEKEKHPSLTIRGYHLPKISKDAVNAVKATSIDNSSEFKWYQLSDEDKLQISFDASGQFAVLTERIYDDPGKPPKSRVIVFSKGADNTLKRDEVLADSGVQTAALASGEDVVTAVAFRGNLPNATIDDMKKWDSLVTGRLNGTVYCGSERLGKPEDIIPAPVVLVRVIPDTGYVVALQQSGAMMVGNCQSRKVVPLPTAVRPSSVMLHQIGKKIRLSYVEAESLFRCVEFDGEMAIDDAAIKRNCGVASIPIIQAVPIRSSDSFLVIEGLFDPTVFTLEADTAIGEVNDAAPKLEQIISITGDAGVSWKPATGKQFPLCDARAQGEVSDKQGNNILALLGEGQNIPKAAVSPKGMYVVWIEYCEQDNRRKTKLYRWARENESISLFSTGESYVAVAVNDKGEIAVTTQDTLFFYGSNGTELSHQLLPALGQCVALSPDGETTLVGDANGNAHLYKNREPVSQDSPTGREKGRSSPASCAVSNNGTAVIGLYDGKVLLQVRKEDKLKPISELVPFFLTKGVQAVSIDRTGRFVAALGKLQSGNCLRPAIGGQSVRLWDLTYPKFPDVPRLSTCFPGSHIVAFGTPEWDNDIKSWVLPLYKTESNSKVGINLFSVEKYPCRACFRGEEKPEAVAKRIAKEAGRYHPQVLGEDRIKALYGIERVQY